MPKQTYFNLSKRRQDEIRHTAMNLFIEREYESIGVREIAAAIGVSVGCFYKYFEDKDEMYLYLLSDTEKKISLAAASEGLSFFQGNTTLEFERYLDRTEYFFNLTWYRIPVSVYYKFYFNGYAEYVNPSLINELKYLESERKLKQHITVETALYCITSSMFNFLIYMRKRKLTDNKEEIAKHRKFLFEKLIFPAILNEDYYRAHYL